MELGVSVPIFRVVTFGELMATWGHLGKAFFYTVRGGRRRGLRKRVKMSLNCRSLQENKLPNKNTWRYIGSWCIMCITTHVLFATLHPHTHILFLLHLYTLYSHHYTRPSTPCLCHALPPPLLHPHPCTHSPTPTPFHPLWYTHTPTASLLHPMTEVYCMRAVEWFFVC